MKNIYKLFAKFELKYCKNLQVTGKSFAYSNMKIESLVKNHEVNDIKLKRNSN